MSVLPLDHLMIRGRPGAPRRPPLEEGDQRPGLLGPPRRGWGAGVTLSQYCIIGRRQIHTRSQGRYWFYAIPTCLSSGGSAMVTTCGFVDVSLSARHFW